jgi:hypothetical protein
MNTIKHSKWRRLTEKPFGCNIYNLSIRKKSNNDIGIREETTPALVLFQAAKNAKQLAPSKSHKQKHCRNESEEDNMAPRNGEFPLYFKNKWKLNNISIHLKLIFKDNLKL